MSRRRYNERVFLQYVLGFPYMYAEANLVVCCVAHPDPRLSGQARLGAFAWAKLASATASPAKLSLDDLESWRVATILVTGQPCYSSLAQLMRNVYLRHTAGHLRVKRGSHSRNQVPSVGVAGPSGILERAMAALNESLPVGVTPYRLLHDSITTIWAARQHHWRRYLKEKRKRAGAR